MLYVAPEEEFRFLLTNSYGDERYKNANVFKQFPLEQAQAVLAEAQRFAQTVIAPTNVIGDRHGSKLENGHVIITPEFHEVYQRFCQQGWPTLRAQQRYGGMQVPQLIAGLIEELWCSANLSFRLAPMLSRSAVEAISEHGSEFLKSTVLPKLISGEWTGTMNLTEPHAGSDVGAVKTTAIKANNKYYLKGQKCFITYGDHTLTSNIVHLILARLEGASSGTKGLSLFVVPKIKIDDQGHLLEKNDVRCLRLENKLGIHASPTCVMSYGESLGSPGAEAHIVGHEGQGMEIMFIMMNLARLAVGIEGHAIGERACQMAKSYASQRVQGKVPQSASTITIDGHPDVRRMIDEMEARVQAARALAVYASNEWDLADSLSGSQQLESQARVALLIPMVKTLGTETGTVVSSLNIQVHGGMGYIEDTGAPQLYRDARIGSIYEGTNGIQAIDFLTRKVLRDQGNAAQSLLQDMTVDVSSFGVPILSRNRHKTLIEAIEKLNQSLATMLRLGKSDLTAALSLASSFLEQFAVTVSAWRLTKQLQSIDNLQVSDDFRSLKHRAVQTSLETILPMVWGHAYRIALSE